MIVKATREHICLLNDLFLNIAPVNFQYSISVECPVYIWLHTKWIFLV